MPTSRSPVSYKSGILLTGSRESIDGSIIWALEHKASGPPRQAQHDSAVSREAGIHQPGRRAPAELGHIRPSVDLPPRTMRAFFCHS